MGFFDNLKKKKEAKELGLSVEQYTQFLIAQSKGICLDSFKRYIASFSGKYSLDQFAQYLALEGAGYTAAQCERYVTELSGKVAAADYADFLAAEQLGLSVSEYAVYAASLKGTMSAMDYVGFLKAQKLGLTMGKYLKYLKSFKGEMTVEEYNTYLKAEENGMDRERYIEYLQKYKDQYTIERYLEFDKARSLGMTLEEYDLRIEASKVGMSLEEYRNHLAAKGMGLSAEEYAIYKDVLTADCIHDGVRQIDFTHYAQADFTCIHKPVAVAEVGQIVEAPAEEPETTISAELEAARTAPPVHEEETEEVVKAQTITVTLAQQFSINIPNEYTYSTEASVIGDNRALIAVLDDAAANFQDPYSATESITILNGKPVKSVSEAAAIAAAIGLPDAQVLIDDVDLNVRYAVKESTNDLTIVLALICTPTKSYPAQFFYNGSSNTDAVAAVRNILMSITAKHGDICNVDDGPKATVAEYIPPLEPIITARPANKKSYLLGNEPAKLRDRVERFFEKLDAAYPDKVIVGLDKDHKHWAETAVVLYRELGYKSRKDFFKSYGFFVGVSKNKGGRPEKNHMEVVEELKRRYADGPVYATVSELKAANPDLAPRFQNLANQANTFFGMPLAKYFIQEGILSGRPEVSYDIEYEKLKSRYVLAPYAGTLSELKSANPDIDWSSISRYHTSCRTAGDLKDFLVEEGILINQEILARNRMK